MEYINKYINKIIVTLTALLMAFTLCIKPCNIYADELTPSDKSVVTSFVASMLVASGVILSQGIDNFTETFTDSFIYKLGDKVTDLVQDLTGAIANGYNYVKYNQLTLDTFNDVYDDTLSANNGVFQYTKRIPYTTGDIITINLPTTKTNLPVISSYSLTTEQYNEICQPISGMPIYIGPSNGLKYNTYAVWNNPSTSSICLDVRFYGGAKYPAGSSYYSTSYDKLNIKLGNERLASSIWCFGSSYAFGNSTTFKDPSTTQWIARDIPIVLTNNPTYSHTGSMPLTLADSVALPYPGFGDDLKDKDADDVRNDDDTIAWPVGGIINPPLPGEGETDTPGEGETDTDDNPVVVIPGVGTLTGGLTGELDDNGQETWKWALSIPILESLLKGINSLINNIKNIDLLKPLKDFFNWLFVPNVDILKASLIELKDMIIASHSLLTYPISLLTNVINKVLSINPGDFIISLDFPFNNNTIHTEFNFSEQARTRFKNYYDVYIMLVNAMLSISVINLGYRKFKHMFDISEG